MDFARLNHILIPDTKDERDRFRQSRAGRLTKPLVRLYLALTPEGRFLSVFWMLSGAASVDVGGSRTYILWSLVTTLLWISLLIRRRFHLDGVEISAAAAPQVVRGEVLPISIRLENRGEDLLTAFRVERPLLPWDGQYVGQRPVIPVLEPGDIKHAVARATFRARGEHHLDPFFVARVVPPGITRGPSLATAGVRFVVVPRPANIARLTLPPRSGDDAEGPRRLTGLNDDPEMIGVRPYRPGDRLRDLHARSWARVGYPVVREFERPVENRVAVRLEPAGDAPETRFEAAVELAAGVVDHLVDRGVAVSLAIPGPESGWLVIRRGSGTHRLSRERLGCVAIDGAWPQNAAPPTPAGTPHTVVVTARWSPGHWEGAALDNGTLVLAVVDDASEVVGDQHIRCVAVDSLHQDAGLEL